MSTMVAGPRRSPSRPRARIELRVDHGKVRRSRMSAAALKTGRHGVPPFRSRPVRRCDGPGIRLVAWTSSRMFRCQYCHNPDTWTLSQRHSGDARAGDRRAAANMRTA